MRPYYRLVRSDRLIDLFPNPFTRVDLGGADRPPAAAPRPGTSAPPQADLGIIPDRRRWDGAPPRAAES